MHDILKNIGLKTVIETNRLYCREESREPQQRGRIRVQLKTEDGLLIKDQFKNKDDLLFYLVDMIPKLKTRSGNQQGKGKKR